MRWPDDRHRLRAGSPLAALAALPILLDVGPEALRGSTRLKAGTAQKIALNMISTGVMARLGYMYADLLVGTRPTNAKLRARAAGITVRQAGPGARGGIGPAGGGWGRRPPGTGRALTRPPRAGIVAPRLDWLPLDAGRSLQHAVVLYLAAQSTRHSR